MDQAPENQPVVVQVSQSSFFNNYWKLLVGIPVILASILALNYFNILTLSLLSPKVFGLLPHKPFNQTFGAYLQSNVVSKPATTAYICPTEKKSCGAGEIFTIIKTTPPITGLGYSNLASGSAVIAIASGEYSSGQAVDQKGNKSVIITITNSTKNVEINYQFRGKTYVPTVANRNNVKPGDTIGWLNDQKLEQGLAPKPYSLIVSIQDLKSKAFIPLNPQELLKSTP